LQNSANTFAGQIDNPQLFEFIKTIRDEHKTWISSFASAQDITDSLRHQFAFLLKASLADRMRLKEQDVSDELKGLRGRALRLALERPPGWEHRLFSQLLNNAINDHADLRLDFEKKFVVGKGRHVGPTDTQWMLEMMAETWPIVEQLGQLIDHDFRDAIGPPGNIGKIRYVADRLAKIHLVALEWSQEVRRTYAHRIMIEAKEGLAEMTTDIVQKIEQIAGEFNKQLSDVEQKIERGEKIEIKLMLSLRLNGLEKFKSGMQLLQARIERGEHLR
jgi:hypothetical protein